MRKVAKERLKSRNNYSAIVQLGTVQIVALAVIIAGLGVIYASISDGIVFLIAGLLVGVFAIAAVVSMLNLYAAIVFLIDEKPVGQQRVVTMLYILLSVALMLMASWLGVMISGIGR